MQNSISISILKENDIFVQSKTELQKLLQQFYPHFIWNRSMTRFVQQKELERVVQSLFKVLFFIFHSNLCTKNKQTLYKYK